MPLAPTTPKMDFVLSYKLRRVAAQLRAIKFHRAGTIIWGGVAIVAAVLTLVQLRSPSLAPYAAPLLIGVFSIATVIAVWLMWRDRTDITDASRYVTKTYPELGSSLQAAVEQRPESNGQFHFLQRRVINDTIRHAETRDWARPLRQEARWLLVGHALALIAALAFSALVIRAHRPAPSRPTNSLPTGIDITPGDAEFERGSTVIVAIRFGGGDLPNEATLVWQPTGGTLQRSRMQRSLSDPVFAFTLPAVTADTAYHIEHDDERTRTFALTVFDRPALLRADAALNYPDYTGLTDRRFVDTRRVSAVVGTELEYDFAMNKALARATLRTSDGREVPLEAASPDATRFRLKTTLAQSEKYTLHLEDRAGRTNGAPIDIRIEALENKRPELKLTFPRGDQRVSPLEEMQLQAEARDDFGLRDYGIGLSVADTAPKYLSMAPAEAKPVVQANIDHLLALETHDVKPDQLVTWFAWAEDIGPDGKVRRTTSDIYFAEIRRLEEIFREDANGGGNQPGGGGGGAGEELLETQRQISIATWKLQQQDTSAASFVTDAETLRDSQKQAQQQLTEIREQLQEARARDAADEALPLMEKAAEALGEVASQKSAESLTEAWAAARGAYQALLKMQPRDANVSQSRGAGQGGSSRNRDQLNELEFRNEEDRYETETQAQPPATPEQREQLGVLARLRELARRQQDINQRLQELQTALAAAEDEAEKESIRRELKRLEEEQRRMLSEVDEARQRVDKLQPGQQQQQAREQLEQTREDMRRASEQIAQGEVSQALAAGSRAQENLQQTSEDLRKEAAGRFGDQMREARRQARELAENQQKANEQLKELNKGSRSLDDSGEREGLAQKLEEQVERRDALLDTIRQVTEESEGTEPRLHRQLYDLLRQQNQSGATRELTTSAELLRRGFVEPAAERQAGVTKEIEQLQRAVERAANSVLGDETNELRFAQRELEELTRELQRDRREGGEQNAPASNVTRAPGRGEEENATQGAQPSAEGETRSATTTTEPGDPATGERVVQTDGPESSDEQEERTAGTAEGNLESRRPGQSGEPGESDQQSKSGESGEPAQAGKPGENEELAQSGEPGRQAGESDQPGQRGEQRRSGPGQSGQGSEQASSSGSSGTSRGGSTGGNAGAGNDAETLEQLAREFGEAGRAAEAARGPLTGRGFADWADRLRTVEELMEEPQLREQLAGARSVAEGIRRENQQQGKAPQWDLVEMGVVAPLQEARAWLRQELNRREQPDALHPIDRDPVPERYAESVRKYYEALGSDDAAR